MTAINSSGIDNESPLINQSYLLEKFPGKGGWTFARIPEILPDRKAHFGWVKVKGTIDGYKISKYHLMPMGNGSLFLPVKAEIRKKIKKQEGDYVHVILYPDNEPLEVPEEMMLCLHDEPEALAFFNTLSESEQKYYIQWIYSAKTEDTKIERLAKSINRLQQKLKMYDIQST
ncbi:MAG: DUF1905 domain-containing protein [Bacteroidales bacterium]|nr:DUF1905 domain-containing protein [Bacteroidales bacterium]